jgi:hypothetical protein
MKNYHGVLNATPTLDDSVASPPSGELGGTTTTNTSRNIAFPEQTNGDGNKENERVLSNKSHSINNELHKQINNNNANDNDDDGGSRRTKRYERYESARRLRKRSYRFIYTK